MMIIISCTNILLNAIHVLLTLTMGCPAGQAKFIMLWCHVLFIMLC